MNRLAVFKDGNRAPGKFCRQLAGLFEIELQPIEHIGQASPGLYTVFDIDLQHNSKIGVLKEWLNRRPAGAKVIFLTDQGSRVQSTQAYALGATDVLERPADGRAVLTTLWGDVSSVSTHPENDAIRNVPAVSHAVDTLKSIFASACFGEKLNPKSVEGAGNTVVGLIEAEGLTAWIDTVRTHHSQTYQHCLLVTGLAAAFGQHLGLGRGDRQRLSVAGMLHDVGKARIPLAILEKPGPLDAAELEVMRKHPQYGFDALSNVSGIPAEMLDIVVHHHEYLDGSGYPHRLQAREISDLVRIMTIADVFGALIERRSYKPPLSGEAAYKILLDMGPKLDKDLVREFRFASEVKPTAAV